MAKEKVVEKKTVIIRPQPGFQEEFLVSDADITIGGGGAGGGKSYALLMKPLYHISNPNYKCIIFRRNRTQIENPGGLWDTSKELYMGVRPMMTPTDTDLRWLVSTGASIKFNHLEYEKNVYTYQGAQIPLIGFDELTHFTQKQFFYLMTRNRSTCGVTPQIIATTNPDPDSWVAKFIDWWIDDEGYPIPSRDGVLRYFYKRDEGMDSIVWGDSREEVYLKCKDELDDLASNKNGKGKPLDLIKSLTFIRGEVDDNKILLDANPGYKGSVAQSADEKHRLLKGNWKFRSKGTELVDADTMEAMFNRRPQTNGRRCISSDVANRGSDKMVVKVFDGFHLIDIAVIARSNGKEIVDAILGMMRRYHIADRDVVFDANGVGSHIDGYIPNAVEYRSQAIPLNQEYYGDLKAQCSMRWADRLTGTLTDNPQGLNYSIDRSLINRIFDGKTLREHYEEERKAIRLAPSSVDGKPRIIKKSEMIVAVGHSPDFIETDIMLELLYLQNDTYTGSLIW